MFKVLEFPIFLPSQDIGHLYLRTGRKDELESAFEKDIINDGHHLGCIGREVKEGMLVGKTIVIVNACVTISLAIGRRLFGTVKKPTKMGSFFCAYTDLPRLLGHFWHWQVEVTTFNI